MSGGAWKIFLCTQKYFWGLLQKHQMYFVGYSVIRRKFSGATQIFFVGFLLFKGWSHIKIQVFLILHIGVDWKLDFSYTVSFLDLNITEWTQNKSQYDLAWVYTYYVWKGTSTISTILQSGKSIIKAVSVDALSRALGEVHTHQDLCTVSPKQVYHTYINEQNVKQIHKITEWGSHS